MAVFSSAKLREIDTVYIAIVNFALSTLRTKHSLYINIYS
jgi:hypothetical protein